jgi:hypothetical protein
MLRLYLINRTVKINNLSILNLLPRYREVGKNLPFGEWMEWAVPPVDNPPGLVVHLKQFFLRHGRHKAKRRFGYRH